MTFQIHELFYSKTLMQFINDIEQVRLISKLNISIKIWYQPLLVRLKLETLVSPIPFSHVLVHLELLASLP